MSRRKDRTRFKAMKGLDPDYKGFRGYSSEPSRPGKSPLEAVTCSVCGRKRNVARGVALSQGEKFVCATCVEEGRAPAPDEAPEVPQQP